MANAITLSRFGLVMASLVLLSSCAHTPPFPPSDGHIGQPTQQQTPAIADIPRPVTVAPYVPPPKAAEKVPTYSVVVSEVPVKELLFALARDTKHNIDIHPNIQGLVTLNAVNETLPAILDRLSKQVSIRYKIEGNTLIVTPDHLGHRRCRADRQHWQQQFRCRTKRWWRQQLQHHGKQHFAQ
jgi:hypothetical protein